MLELSRISDKGRDMANKKFVVKLSGEERERLREVIKGQVHGKEHSKGAHSHENGSGLAGSKDLPRARHQHFDGGPVPRNAGDPRARRGARASSFSLD
jgi:hypothetical protein